MVNYFIFNQDCYTLIDYGYNIQMAPNKEVTLELKFISPQLVDVIYNNILQAQQRKFSLNFRSRQLSFYPQDMYKENDKLIFKF